VNVTTSTTSTINATTSSTSTTSTTSTSTTTISGGHSIILKSRTFVPDEGIDSALNISELSLTDYVIIQFEYIPSSANRATLSQLGVALLDYVPEYSFFASVDKDYLEEVANLSFVRSVVKILPGDRTDPGLADGIPSWGVLSDGTARMRVIFFSDASPSESEMVLQNHTNQTSMTAGPYSLNDWLINGYNDTITGLANESTVQWVELFSPNDTDANDGARAAIGVDTVQASPYGLNGLNVRVGQWEWGRANGTHPDLYGRVVTVQDNGHLDHATHVAGTVGGTGNMSNGRLRGMAPNVTFYAYSTSAIDEPADHNDAINTYKINLSQNSWRNTNAGYQGSYRTRSSKFDDVVDGLYGRKIPIIFIAGNEQGRTSSGYGTVMPPGGTAKNPIVVGAVNSDDRGIPWFTSFGPTDDGRLKPDIVAPGCQAGGDGGINSTTPDAFINVYNSYDWDGSGDDFRYPYDIMCGTSMAAPVVSGATALILQQFKNRGNSKHSTLPLPSTFKALMIHTALDLNATGPDYVTGYGLINVTKAVDMLRRGGNNDVIAEETVSSSGETDQYTMYVSNYTTELRVTLAWDDKAASVSAGKQLVNDLDLVLMAPNGSIYRPWNLSSSSPQTPATKGIDRLNNVEQVYVNGTVEGNWTINVTGYVITDSNDPQNYSLIYNNFFPEIFMSDSVEDDGTVPTDAPYWTSPGVWVDSDFNGVADITPVPGQVNHLYATVRALGGGPVNNVDAAFYWANPSTAINYPDDWSYIGGTNISSVSGYGSENAYVSWIPPATPEHQCIMVMVNSSEDPIVWPGDIRWDNNIGMKNFWIINLNWEEMYSFEFEAGNPGDDSDADATLDVDTSDVPDGWSAYVYPEYLYGLGAGEKQTITLTVIAPAATVGEASIGAGTAGQNATIHITEYLTTDSGEEITGGVSVTFVIAGNETTTTNTTSTSTTSTSSSTSTTVPGECTLTGDEPPCGEIELAEVIDLINLWAADGAELSEVIDLINAWASD